MRETRTSGSVRGGDGNVPAYSAFINRKFVRESQMAEGSHCIWIP